jgi:hypothetical protein
VRAAGQGTAISATDPRARRPKDLSSDDETAPPSPPAPTPQPTDKAEPVTDDARGRLHAHLAKSGLTHLADAVENSRVVVAGGDLQVVTAKSYKLYFEDKQFSEAVRSVFGRTLRVQITLGEAEATPAAPPVVKEEGNDTTRRALAHPEVRRFQEVFGGEVRKVRNLKE